MNQRKLICAALELQLAFTEAAVNLADLYRLQGRDAEGEKTLRQALALEPQNAAAHHALGLLLIRQKKLPEALIAGGKLLDWRVAMPATVMCMRWR